MVRNCSLPSSHRRWSNSMPNRTTETKSLPLEAGFSGVGVGWALPTIIPGDWWAVPTLRGLARRLAAPARALTLALVVVLSLAVLALTILAPCFHFDNGLVYGGF